MQLKRKDEDDEATPTSVEPPPPPAPRPGLLSRLVQIVRRPRREPRPFTPLPADDSLLAQEPMYDSEAARRRSLMHQQKVKCTGEADGHPCIHFWALTAIVDSQNADHLVEGERFKMCTYFGGGEPLVFGDGKTDMAVKCNRYTPDKALAYEPLQDGYQPMSPDEIRAVQEGTIKSHEDLMAYREAHKNDVPDEQPDIEQTVSIDEVLASTPAKETP